jgi:TnpA family transposase
MIFGAFDLLGLRFAPRIRDLDHQRLYRHGSPPAVDVSEAAAPQAPPSTQMRTCE